MISKRINKMNKRSPVFDTNATIVVCVKKEGSRWNAYDKGGNKFTNFIGTVMRQKAYESGQALDRRFYKDGRPYWRLVSMGEFETSSASSQSVNTVPTVPALNLISSTVTSTEGAMESNGSYTPFTTQEELITFIAKSYALKPRSVFIKELYWKLLVRAVLRGKNVGVVGMQGAGKTLIARTVGKILGRPTFVFPLGEVSDPKSFLLGNSQYDTASGTCFYPSRFIRAIQTKGAVVVLDEMTRPHPDVQNVLMSVLDPSMRYLILDETRENAVVQVADGVTFIATANIGNEFTATRVLDRAFTDRFSWIEIPVLEVDEEWELLQLMYPSVNKNLLRSVAEIACKTRTEIKSDNPKLSTAVSTRISVEIGGLLFDGFSLTDAAETCIYPFFDQAGGLESERTYVKQIVQGFVDGSSGSLPDNLFGEDDINKAPN